MISEGSRSEVGQLLRVVMSVGETWQGGSLSSATPSDWTFRMESVVA